MKFDNIYQQIWEKVDLKGMKPKNFNTKTLKKGQKVEMEHSDNPKVAQKIAQQHMVEFPKQDKNKKIDSDYYEELENTETKLKKTLTKSFDSMVKDIKKSVSESQTLLENRGNAAWFIINGKPVNADDWHEKYVVNYLKKTKKEAGIPLTDEEQKIVYGLVDPVPYALKLGWIRVRILESGIVVEMQTLNADTVKQLVDGIWEIKPDIKDNQPFLIDIISPKEITYAGVPFELLQSGELNNINYYNASRSWGESKEKELPLEIRVENVELTKTWTGDREQVPANVIRDVIRIEYPHASPKEVAHGHCFEFAEAVASRLPGAVVRDVDLWAHRGKPDLPYHVWVEVGGKAYDAETPSGAASWRNLPYFREHSNQAILSSLKARDYPTSKATTPDSRDQTVSEQMTSPDVATQSVASQNNDIRFALQENATHAARDARFRELTKTGTGGGKQGFKYRSTLRPATKFNMPTGLVRSEEDGSRFGVGVYDKPLTRSQIEQFSLEPLDPEDPINLAKRGEEAKKRIDALSGDGNKAFTIGNHVYSKDTRRPEADDAWRMTMVSGDTPTGHIEFDSYREARNAAVGDMLRAEVAPDNTGRITPPSAWGDSSNPDILDQTVSDEGPYSVKEEKAERQKQSFSDYVNYVSTQNEIQLETSMAGAGGVFGDSPEIGTHGGQVGNSDWYAPGDARNLFGNNCKCKSKSKHKGKSKCKCRTCTCSRATILPLTKRTFTK